MGTPKDNIAIAAAFLSGFYTLQTLNFCWTASFPTLLKFGISPSKIGCFMGETGSSMNYWVSWGILLAYGLSFCGWTDKTAFIAPGISTVIYCLAFAYTCYVKRFSRKVAFWLFVLVLGPIIGSLFAIGIWDFSQADKAVGQYVCPMVSCFTTVCTFITHCIIFYVVVFGHGYEGARKLYFWLSASALAYQFDSSITVKVAGKDVAWLFFAMEVSYFIIPFVHLCCDRSHKALGVRDLNFFTVFWHLFSVCITTVMAVELWIVSVYMNWDNPMFISPKSADQAPLASLVRCLSPFFMGIIGMGSIFWLFPAVWPFMVCHYAHFRFVMLFSAVLSSPATLIPWFLSDGDKIGIGGAAATKFNIWSIYKFEGGAYYHFTWLVILFIFILFGIHMCCIHYPRCFVARSVLHSRWAVVCGSLFFFLTSLFKAVGLTGCFANAIGPWFFASAVTATFKNDTSTQNTKITIDGNSGDNVTFGSEYKTSTLTFTFNGRTLASNKTLTIDSTPKIQLIGLKYGVEIKSLVMDGPTTAVTLDVNSNTFTKAAEIAIGGTGTGKAGGFSSADNTSGHWLTKIVYSGLSLSDGFTIDGFPVSGGAGKLELGFTNAIQYSASKLDLNGVSASASNFTIEGDLAHGPTFGTVSFNFSLFHLTASIFTSQAYSVGVGSFKFAVDSGCSWPTQGVGGVRSFFWWSHYGLKNGNRRFWGLADIDIISVIS